MEHEASRSCGAAPINSSRPADRGGQRPAPAQPHAYRVRAHSLPGRHEEDVAGDRTIPFDATWGDPASGPPGPAELLESAFATCRLKNVERTSKLLGIRYQGATGDFTAERQDAPPKFTAITYELRLTTAGAEERVELLHRNLRKFGSVSNTLAACCSVEGRIVTLPPGAWAEVRRRRGSLRERRGAPSPRAPAPPRARSPAALVRARRPRRSISPRWWRGTGGECPQWW